MTFEKKYLKYKKKYLNLKKQIGGEPRYTIIPKKTYWFRCAPNICNYNSNELCKLNVKQCSDTGKTGIYFASNIIIAISMCLEYDKLLELGIFLLTEDINVSVDKYEFRQVNKDRYFDKEGKIISSVDPTEEENISHIKCELTLLKLNESKTNVEELLPYKKQNELNEIGSCELFLTKDDITKIEIIEKFRFNPDLIKSPKDLEKYLMLNDYPFNPDKYIEDKILIKFDCNSV